MPAAKKPNAGGPKKVFDIARPNNVKPSASSRPIIVGHGPIMIDPMMSKGTAVESAKKTVTLGSLAEALTAPRDATADTMAEPLASNIAAPRKKISPVTTAASTSPETNIPVLPLPKQPIMPPKPAVEAIDSPSSGSEPAAAATEPSSSDSQGDEGATVDAVASQTKLKQERQKQQEAENAKRQATEKLIEDQTYFLSIHQARSKRSSRASTVLLVLFLLAGIGVYAAVDAGKLDVGINMPYDFIKN